MQYGMLCILKHIIQRGAFQFQNNLLIVVVLIGCTGKTEKSTLFEELPSSITNIQFVNEVLDQEDFNIFNYRNFYNGGGVAIGDVNNDSLPDIFLISNLGDNKLYLNRETLSLRTSHKQPVSKALKPGVRA